MCWGGDTRVTCSGARVGARGTPRSCGCCPTPSSAQGGGSGLAPWVPPGLCRVSSAVPVLEPLKTVEM